MATWIAIGLLAVSGAIALGMAIRIVPEYRRLVIFRLGRCTGARGPGLVWLIPFVDRGVPVDLREVFFDVQPQTCITCDNASVSIDFIVYDKVIDPVLSVLEVENFTGAARGLAITTLRAVVGAMVLDDVLSKREDINRVLHEKLDRVTDRWGIRIMAVEIREVVPPAPIEEAMTRQMAAERNRRAMVAEANGQRESAIMVAEGDRQSTILRAEAERQAAVLRAEGFALGLKQIASVAEGVDGQTLTLQYLDTLKQLGSGDSTKFVIPMEFVNLLRPVVEQAARAMRDDPAERVAAVGASGS
jgi:regulator of protease activity HflC (stomatin/prohibitin superfamily)